jgi:glucokinase
VGRCVLAIDVGGTKILGGLVTAEGSVLDQRRLQTRRQPAAQVIPYLGPTHDVLVGLVTSAVERNLEITAVGVSLPEYVDRGRLTSHEVLQWDEQPGDVIVASLAAQGYAEMPVAVESDVRAGARGETWLGAGAGMPSMLYCSWGTGISSAFVIDGHCWAGRRGEAVAMGELRATCPDSRRLESIASGRGIEESFAGTTGTDSGGVREIDQLATDGDRDARAVLEEAGAAMADALSDLVAVLDPHAVVLGGGLGASDHLAGRTARRRCAELLARRPDPPALMTAALGDHSALLGAARAALELS